MKKHLLSILIFLVMFSLPFIHVLSNSDLWINTGNVENKEEIISNIDEFFLGNEDLNYFDENVKAHFLDVRILLWYSKIILISVFALSLLLAVYMKKEEIILSTKNASKAIIAIWIILIFWLIFSFKSFFLLFHKLFFEGNYSLPSSNLVIQLFPNRFFFSIGIFIAFFEIVFSIIILVILKDSIHKNSYKK